MFIPLYAAIVLTALAILICLFINTNKRRNFNKTGKKLYHFILVIIGLLVITDFIMWCHNGIKSETAIAVNTAVNYIYFILTPLPAYLWLIYVEYRYSGYSKRLSMCMMIFSVPVIVNYVFCIINPFTNILFSISYDNIYIRGPVFWFSYASTYIYMIDATVRAIINSHKLGKKNAFSYIIFLAIPVFGGILQLSISQISIIWLSTVLALLFIFIGEQNEEMHTDYLTGLFNRRQLENYMRWQLERKNRKQPLVCVMFDINSFKKINDTHGHAVGDEAIENAGKIIKSAFPKETFISRYAGDEFVAVLECDDTKIIDSIENNIRAQEHKFNCQNVPYNIVFSFGTMCCERHKHNYALEDIMKEIDDKMYANKQKCKEVSVTYAC